MTLSALRLRERETSFPDLSISILLLSQGAFAEHVLCTGPYTRHWKYWEPDSPWRSFSQVQSVNMWEYLTTGWDKIEWRISEGGKNKYEWKLSQKTCCSDLGVGVGGCLKQWLWKGHILSTIRDGIGESCWKYQEDNNCTQKRGFFRGGLERWWFRRDRIEIFIFIKGVRRANMRLFTKSCNNTLTCLY